MTALEKALERVKAKRGGSFDTGRRGVGDSRLDPESEQYDPDGFREERGERMMECERDEE